MNPIYRDVFQAIHEGKWMTIEYRNREGQVTRYWIGIQDLDPRRKTLKVEGMHLGLYRIEEFPAIYLDSILSSEVLEGTWYPVNEWLVKDISRNPHKYRPLFEHAPNLKILNYLEDCSRMDTTPYKADFALVSHLDRDSFYGEQYSLDDEQFRDIVRDFQIRARGSRDRKENGKIVIQQLAMNVTSLHTSKGLYVLAYRRMRLDVKQRCLRPDEDITVCREFTVGGYMESIRRFLDAEDYELLDDFEGNQEQIKDALTRAAGGKTVVDDLPYLIGLGMDLPMDLHKEYNGILEMYRKGEVTVPIKAFFGELLDRPRGSRPVPFALLNQRLNLDQLLAIHNAMKYPVAYIQGPPGTGKTNTILNTVLTAFFNEKTVLLASYNNHPIDGVVEKLENLKYRGKKIPFPVIRLGNQEKVKEALKRMRELYESTEKITVYTSTLERNRDGRAERAKRLSGLLRRYEELLDLKERKEAIDRLLEYHEQHGMSVQQLPFEADLKGRQLEGVERRMEKVGEVTDEDAWALLTDDKEDLYKYLYYISVQYIRRIGDDQNRKLREILYMEEGREQMEAFGTYLGNAENLKRFQKIFPVIATTCISAHRLGPPEPCFDMTVMDEASQCNTAVSLTPIIRGRKLMLVGDPQQLNPVILLDETSNERLRRKYMVPDEYDYRKNSIYKTYLACDPVSDEVLLRYHYRCSPKIIEFNNKKYYNSKLLIRSQEKDDSPLVYMDMEDGKTDHKNTAPAEVDEVIRYAETHKDQSIGVITPFVNQRKAIEDRLKEKRLTHVSCGTVHAFQGDEKDVVLFSTALTDETYAGTYEWLKNNRELINVAVSRARNRLIVLSSTRNLERLHQDGSEDDLYDLIRYVQTNGQSQVAPKEVHSRALGVKPFSTATEEAFLTTLNHALDNLWLSQNRFSVEKEVAVSQVFQENVNYSDLFYSGRFDFVVYEQRGNGKYPVLVIELDGKEHFEEETVKARDRKKQAICKVHDMELIRVENSYARRYQYMKDILATYFAVRH